MDKIVERMQRNAADDWAITDIQKLCNALDWLCLPPSGGGSRYDFDYPCKAPNKVHLYTQTYGIGEGA